LALQREALEKIIVEVDNTSKISETVKFLAIKKWAEKVGKRKAGSGGLMHDSTNKHTDVTKLVEGICLSSIRPSVLLSDGLESGLVSKEQVFDILMGHTLQAEKAGWIFDRNKPCWMSSGDLEYTCSSESHSTEILNCPEMRTGVSTWSIEIVTYCNWVWVGVASRLHPLSASKWLGGQKGGWVYGANGAACHATGIDNGPYNEVHPTYNSGDVIKLTLDLTGAGELIGRVNKGDPVLLFDNMKSDFEKDCVPSFIPAVSLRKPGAIELVRFGDELCKQESLK